MTTLKRLPDISCAYENYDPNTLKPVNSSTFTRLMELGWTKEEFEGKSVLDIGGNSGILSLYAHNLGAKKIRYVDVQVPLVEFFQSVVSKHELPIDIERKGFLDLNPETDSKDIVLLMEVLHWLVDQGGTVPDSLEKLAALTNDTLYLETPWDAKEPSIAAKGIVFEEHYNIEMIIRELQSHFETVEMVRFMSYFGEMANSKRILIKATGKRANNLHADVDIAAIDQEYSLAPTAAAAA
jgi:SAM-dependent methyltransferase